MPLLDDNIGKAVQTRYRFVLDEGDDRGTPCPELMDSKPCPDIPKCGNYKWEAERWSHCIFPKHYEKCGEGYRARGNLLLLGYIRRNTKLDAYNQNVYYLLLTCDFQM